MKRKINLIRGQRGIKTGSSGMEMNRIRPFIAPGGETSLRPRLTGVWLSLIERQTIYLCAKCDRRQQTGDDPRVENMPGIDAPKCLPACSPDVSCTRIRRGGISGGCLITIIRHVANFNGADVWPDSKNAPWITPGFSAH